MVGNCKKGESFHCNKKIGKVESVTLLSPQSVLTAIKTKNGLNAKVTHSECKIQIAVWPDRVGGRR